MGLPAGFVVSSQPSGQGPGRLTDFDYLPDGSMITTGKNGTVAWVSADGATTRQLATLPVAVKQDLGLVGIAVAPDYQTSRTIYLARALPAPDTGPWTLRLSRFTVTGSAEPTGISGEVTLLQTTATGDVHAITGIEAVEDGTLWVAVGDAAEYLPVDPNALRALDVNDPRGKVLHIRGTDGAGVPGNPFYEAANPGSTRSKVYAMGFRSPFRLSIHQPSGAPILGDVGWNTWEEVNLVRPGVSYGWPCFEGNGTTPGYRDLAGCAGKTNTAPLHLYQHTAAGDRNSVTGGVVYTGDQYPAEWRGAYFFGDYTADRVWTMRIGADGRVTRGPETDGFGRNMGKPVSFDTGPGGDIVYADILSGRIMRLSHTAGNRPPTAVATTTTDPATRTVTFDGSQSYDLDEELLTYSWDFGDGTPRGTGERTSHTYAAGTGTLTARLTVTDARGGADTEAITVAPSNNAPQVALTAPPPGRVFTYDEMVNLTASGSDVEDGPLPVTWSVTNLHCPGTTCHDHPGESFTAPAYARPFHNHDNSEQRITATVTDSVGVAASRTFLAEPDLRTVTVTSNVPVTPLINGVERATAEVTVGGELQVSVPATAADGVSTFGSWTNGGARSQNLVVGTEPISLTATYVTPIEQRYNSDAALRAAVGAPTAPEQGDAALRWRDYANGRAYWSAPTGVHFVAGAIWQKFIGLGAHGTVGAPATDELGTPNGTGRFNRFTTGAHIHWSADTGAHLTQGRILANWGVLGYEAGPLGYPTTDELVTPDGIGRFNQFQGGSIYWSPGTDAWAVQGAIRTRWGQTGYERSPLGYPRTNETRTPDGVGRFNHFQGGSIYWSPGTGAWNVQGAILARWRALGWERSYLGYPTSGELDIPGGKRSNFQRGYITWNAATGQVIDRRY